MSDFNVDDVLSGTVEEISAKLTDYSGEQLTALHDAEEKREGGPRTTLLAAIHSAQSPAAPNAEAPAADETAAPAAPEKAAKEKAPAKATKGKKAPAIARETLKIDGEAGDLTPALEYHDAAVVAMTDSDGAPIDGWPPLEFPADAFERAPAGVVLKEAIDMDIGLPRGDVCAVWLLVGGKPMAVARLAVPLTAGGGRRASFPKGSLRFRTDG